MAKKQSTPEQKQAAQAARAAKKAAAEAAARDAERERERLLTKQLENVSALRDRIDSTLSDMRRRERSRVELLDHCDGFYEEVDKLAKGRSLLQVTPLILDEANQIIGDAKAIITSDPFLDRIKQFVPAGENPVYPDVVVSMRGVIQALKRAEDRLEADRKHLRRLRIVALTIRTAADLWLNQNLIASHEDVVEALQPVIPASGWFVREGGTLMFDYKRLEQADLTTEIPLEPREGANPLEPSEE